MDDAFLAALAANFDDETTRLVYADWLDERGDPRGQFLRAEVEWARLHIDDEAFPAALARLSVSQRGIGPDWVMRVSRLPALVRQTWNSACPRLVELDPVRPTEGMSSTNHAWVAEVYKTFCLNFGAASVAQRFCVPTDYEVFMSIIGGGGRGQAHLWDVAVMQETTAKNCTRINYECRLEDGLWLNIGAQSVESSLFLCCDSNHHMFSHIVAGRVGDHPWFDMRFLAPTFLHYILNVLRDVELDLESDL